MRLFSNLSTTPTWTPSAPITSICSRMPLRSVMPWFRLSGLFINFESIIEGADGEVGEHDLVLDALVDQARYLPCQKNINRHFLGNCACAFQIVVGYVKGVFRRRLGAIIALRRHTRSIGAIPLTFPSRPFFLDWLAVREQHAKDRNWRGYQPKVLLLLTASAFGIPPEAVQPPERE